jgi:hypothetical protein
LLFRIPPREMNYSRRGFPTGEPATRRHLDRILRTAIEAYHTALDDYRPEVLGPKLHAVDLDVRGFAFEGAGLCLGMLDLLTPWRKSRFQAFLKGPGAIYTHLLHVGHGLALARLGFRANEAVRWLEGPGGCWLAADAYGFHEGFFRWRHYVERAVVPVRASGYARRSFDQGLGRVMWFGCAGDLGRIARLVEGFAPARRGDLWSGLGVACTYAGGVGEPGMRALREMAGPYLPHLAQGAVFAVHLRQYANDVIEHTERACRVLTDLSPAEAGRLVEVSMQDPPPEEGPIPNYEIVRRRVQQHFAVPTEVS